MIHISDWVAALSIAALLILGGYQIYFLPQRYRLRSPISLMTSLDRRIPFRPKWVWVYSGLYYPFIISIIATLDDFRHYAFTAMSFIVLLLAQLIIAFLWPVRTPDSWRDYDSNNSASEKFLALVHSYDEGGNCFPSMHVAVATLAALHILFNLGGTLPIISAVVVLATVLIFVSTTFTKQHFLADLPAGFCLAVVVYWGYSVIYWEICRTVWIVLYKMVATERRKLILGSKTAFPLVGHVGIEE